MKNYVIAIKDENFKYEFLDSCTHVFTGRGYKLEKTLIINENDVVSETEQIKDDEGFIAVYTSKNYLVRVRNSLISIGFEVKQTSLLGASILKKNNRLLFLLSYSNDVSGNEYAENECIPYAENAFNVKFSKMFVRFVAVSENVVHDLIARLKNYDGGRLSYRYENTYGDGILEMIYDSNTPRMLTDDVLRITMETLGDNVYAMDESTLENSLVSLLKVRGKKIAVAESFTGGGIARRIVSVSGASEVYYEGINTYSEESKMRRLGVSAYTLNTVGAVSDQTAYEMASGLLRTNFCDIAIATTGLAGPNGDKFGHPVGLCYVAIGTKERIYVYKYDLKGNRSEITEQAINLALFETFRQLKNVQ